MKRYLFFVILLISILILSGCSIISGVNSTPIPEKPISEMSAKPPHGVTGGDSIGDAYMPELGNNGYDVQHYDIDMAFSSQLEAITATVTITSKATLNKLGRISLDFTNYQVDSVKVEKQYAAFYRMPDKLIVDLPKGYSTGTEFNVQIAYHGQIQQMRSEYFASSPLGFIPNVASQILFAFSEPNGAHAWFPCNDHPKDKATFQFELSVPKGLTGIANGTLLETVPTETSDKFIWSESAPMATYLATIVVGDYQRLDAPAVGNVKIRHYVLAGDIDYSKELAITQDMLQFFSNQLGPYPFDEYGYVIIRTTIPLGMESQTMVMIDRSFLIDQNVGRLFPHEMAHQWFGDSVTVANWQEIWLQEGLADYMWALWMDHQEVGGLTDILGAIEANIQAYGKDQPLNSPPPQDMFGFNTYYKGAWVFHMLRQELGDQVFFRFLRQYYERFAGGTVTTADLQKFAEEISGKDLTAFFNQWVYAADNPQLNVTWASQPGGVSMQICQKGSQLFTFPLEVQLESSGGTSKTEVIQVDEKQERATFNLPFSATSFIVDPEQKVLANVNTTKVNELAECAP